MRAGLLVRWLWADLRRRWLQVLAISAVLALGVGMYAGLGSMESWRVTSNDASYALLRAHDLRVSVAEGGSVPEGRLRAVAAGVEGVAVARERLVVPTQIDASTSATTVLTPGRIVGGDVAPEAVDAIHVTEGRGLRTADRGRNVAVMEARYGDAHGLPSSGRLRLAGGATLDYVGHGRHPDYFIVTAPGISFGAEEGFGVVFTSLATAQRLADTPGMVNEVVVRLADGADPADTAARLQAAMDAALPGVGTSVTAAADEEAHRILYQDAKNDQRVYNVVSLLVLFGAALAAFNLASRVVESQRREIGISMALGMPPSRIALRPLLLGLQIAILGAALGIVAALGIAALLRPVLADLLPLPVLVTDLQPEVLVRGALLAVAVPLAATAYPVWRGVRVPPIDAIRTGPRAVGGGPARRLRRLRLPGRTLTQMGPRNATRSPRRTLMTALGLAAVIGALLAITGMLDSFDATLGRSERETAGATPDRVVIDLDGFHPTGAEVVRRIAGSDAVAAAEPGVTVTGQVTSEGGTVGVRVSLVDPESTMWTPTVTSGSLPTGAGEILLSEAAAADLGVGPGDDVRLQFPRVTSQGTVALGEATLRVSGTHPNPFRFLAYMHPNAAALFGVAGAVNTVSVVPAAGRGTDDVARATFRFPGVASVQAAAAGPRSIRERLDDFGGILRVAEGIVLLLALLIAFNAATIATDERRREHATLLAFGVPVRSVVGVVVAESVLIGVLGTLAGVVIGRAILGWIVNTLFAETLPDIGTVVSLSADSLVTAAVVGVLATACAPLLTARTIGRINIPSALRTVE